MTLPDTCESSHTRGLRGMSEQSKMLEKSALYSILYIHKHL